MSLTAATIDAIRSVSKRVEVIGRAPKGNGPWLVEFRSGWVSGPYTKDQIRWGDTGSDWDAVAVFQSAPSSSQETWNPKAGGY